MCTRQLLSFREQAQWFFEWWSDLPRGNRTAIFAEVTVVEQGRIIPHLPGAEAFTHVAIKIDYEHIRFEAYHTLLGAICS
jgi:hypothetical protein